MKKVLCFAAGMLLTAGIALAQVTTGTVVGTVKDSTGAVVPNTSVTVTNEGTGVVYTGKTNDSGEYRVGDLPDGLYDVRSLSTGFAPVVVKGLAVAANRSQTADLVLTVGTSTSVEVTSEAAVTLDTTSSQLQTVFDAQEVQDLPTATIGLGALNLSLLAPGTANVGAIGAGTGPSVGGQRPRNNNFEIDGIDNNSKSVTGPLLFVPNDAIGEFSFLENFYGAQYGHSTGGQFNSLIQKGTNTVHGRLYEYFDNRNLNAVDAVQARANAGNGVSPKFQPRYDYNRYGGQLGGPVFKDRLFLFSNFERQTVGESQAGSSYCAPTAAGFAALNGITFQSANNYGVFKQYTPTAAAQAPAAGDAGCPNGNTIAVTSAAGTTTNIPVGDFSVAPPLYQNEYFSTSSADWIIRASDSLHVRYVYNREDGQDTSSSLPVFYTTSPTRLHLVSIDENHIFSPSVANEFRIGYNRIYTGSVVNNASFPKLAQFPNLIFDELGNFDLGPDPNAPQSTIQNLYQAIDTVTWVKGKHTIILGGEGRKYISPQLFVQRQRGDYEYSTLSTYLNDLTPDIFGQRNALGPIGNPNYYGDQTAFYAYGNDDWRVTPNLTINLGLRYEFTSIPAGEKQQSFNSAASVSGLITFGKPSPQYKNFAPRVGFNYSPDANTSIRGGFGMGYDVLYDNIGTTEAPPQFQSTQNVNTTFSAANPQLPNFLANGGLPGSFTFPNLAAQRAATTAYIPNQQLPYSEEYTLGIQHVFHRDYTAEVRYVGTRGIHLDVQDRFNVQSPANAANQLPTVYGGSTSVVPNGANTKASLSAIPYIIPAYSAAGFTNIIVSDNPYGSSNYNGLESQLQKRMRNGLLLNVSYTYSKAMDNSTADFNTSAINPRRPQDFQNIAAEESLSALSRKHRLTVEAVYDLAIFKGNHNWFLRNIAGNWEITPLYTFQSPQYTTVQSGIDSNLNGDSATDRVFINPNGVPGTGSLVVPVFVNNAVCGTAVSTYALPSGGTTAVKSCSAAIIGYAEGSLNATTHVFTPSNAYYVQGGSGTSPNASRNTLPTGRTNDWDVSAFKRFDVYKERLKLEFGAQAFNVFNHSQFLPGSINQVNSIGSTGSRAFVTVSTPATFNQPRLVFSNNARSMQLSGKIIF